MQSDERFLSVTLRKHKWMLVATRSVVALTFLSTPRATNTHKRHIQLTKDSDAQLANIELHSAATRKTHQTRCKPASDLHKALRAREQRSLEA